MIWLIIAAICFIIAVIVGLDIFRFGRAQKRAEKPTAAKADAGGHLYIQGNRTYYKMPKGNVRKIADYPMDLRPGSRDMIMFTDIMNQAADEHAKEVSEMKAEAVANVREIANAAALAHHVETEDEKRKRMAGMANARKGVAK